VGKAVMTPKDTSLIDEPMRTSIGDLHRVNACRSRVYYTWERRVPNEGIVSLWWDRKDKSWSLMLFEKGVEEPVVGVYRRRADIEEVIGEFVSKLKGEIDKQWGVLEASGHAPPRWWDLLGSV